jgi:hypothetical protein
MTSGSRTVLDSGHDGAVPLYLPLLRERADPDPDLARLRATRPVVRLDVPADEVEYRTLSLVHGVRSLPVSW